MRIGLKQRGAEHVSSKDAENKALEKAIWACKKGDWAAKDALGQIFHPLLKKMAERRTDTENSVEISQLMNHGKDALSKAAKKYKLEKGAHHFRVFAVPFVEKAMDKRSSSGLLSKLFGK